MTTRPLSFHEQTVLDKELDATERLQWYVRPRSLPGRREVRNAVLVSGANIIFAGVFWLLLLGGQEIDPLAWFISCFVGLIAAGVILGLSSSMFNACHSVYVVTNMRAMVLRPRSPFCGFRVQTYPLASNMIVEVVERSDGSGDIVLAYENSAPDVTGKRPPLGFLRINHVNAVADALAASAEPFSPRTDAEHARYMNWADPQCFVRKPDKSLALMTSATVLMGCAAVYGSTFLLEKPLHYLLHAERTVGRVVAAQIKDKDAFQPIYEFRTAQGSVIRQKVENTEYFCEPQLGLETTILYFADAPEQAMALCPRTMFGTGAFLACWGLMFMTGGCLGLLAYRQQVAAWSRLHEK
ncbi:MAG: DUF3592 domain-containing protein [Akkermansia sp.]|nr:DUF3592 domain-containing protein [Akkermansia sp.]MBR2313837.1 DUF3592 domain-containing protein [Akkermansia sp.]